MAKTDYQVTFNGKVVGISKSDRIYTHAVVVQDDADAFYHWAHNYMPNEADRRNFAYDSKHAVQIVEQYTITGHTIELVLQVNGNLKTSKIRREAF